MKLAVVLAVTLALPGVLFGQQGFTEYQVKAAFLLNFAKFVDWPPEAFAAKDSPLSVCIFGFDPFGQDLDRLATARTIQHRPIRVTRVGSAAAARGCHVIFLSAQEQPRGAELLRAIAGLPVLSVGESADFLPAGGAIRFVPHRNQVWFDINTDAAQAARLKISSKLLALAHEVHPKAGGG